MRKFGLTIAMVAVLGAGALGTGATASADSADSAAFAAPRGDVVGISAALGPKQRLARKRALRKCKAKRTQVARKSCRNRVIRRFRPKPVQPAAPAVVVDVSDDIFTPNVVSIKSGDTIKWVWNDVNHDPHNVTMTSGPAGIDRKDFETSSSPAVQFTFSRAFTKPGTYTFACSLHVRMTMTVVVS